MQLTFFERVFFFSVDESDSLNQVFEAGVAAKFSPAFGSRHPIDLTTKEKIIRKLRTKKGQTEYVRRKTIIGPVFCQIKHCQGFREFLLRGLDTMTAEWRLVCLTHNLLIRFRSRQPATAVASCG